MSVSSLRYMLGGTGCNGKDVQMGLLKNYIKRAPCALKDALMDALSNSTKGAPYAMMSV